MQEIQKTNIDVVPGMQGAEGIISSGEAITKTETLFHTAVRVQVNRPRLDKIISNAIVEAKISGEKFYYSWSAGGKKVEGPSIKLINAAARLYGNCAIVPMPLQETPTSYIFASAFVDYETGFNMARQFKQSKKWKVHGKYDDERKDDMRFQIGQSKSHRNIGCNALPDALIDRMLESAKQGVRESIEKSIKTHSIEVVKDKMFKAFKDEGIEIEAIESKLCKKHIAFDVEDIVRLKGDLEALHNGQELAENLFPTSDKEEKSTKPGITSNRKKKLTAKELIEKEKADWAKFVLAEGATVEEFDKLPAETQTKLREKFAQQQEK